MTPTRELRVETSTVCNYRCVMCPHATMRRRHEIMPTSLFAQILEMARRELPHLTICTVSGFGEFAADPHWIDKLALAHEAFDRVHVVTNLSLVEDDALETLASLATELRVSLYATTEETFHRVHRGPAQLSYEVIEERLRRLAALRGDHLELSVTACELSENRHEIPQLIERWRDVVDHVEIWRPHNWVDGKRYRVLGQDRLPSCGRPASGPLQVQVDGTMNVCCFDYDGKMLIGNLKRQSFAEILDGSELRRIRELHATGRADELPLCAVCDQRDPPERKASYLVYTSRGDAEARVKRTSSGMETIEGA